MMIKNQKPKYPDKLKSKSFYKNSVSLAHACKRVIEFILSKNDNVSWFPNFIFVYANNDMI